jgi:NTP pyrophosphatase (non-canonical NTP hydrolase)
MYYLYHIPGKKIGVTRNLFIRVTKQQGYKPNEYEVLEQSDDIDYISDREIELQKSYGYRVDNKKYKNLYFNKLNKMKINPTDQTTTFPVPMNKLKGALMDNQGTEWDTWLGKFKISSETIPWIVANAKPSMYNDGRCYIYNKAYHEAFIAEPALGNNTFDLIRSWADVRGITQNGDVKTQYIKLLEEVGELADAILKNNKEDIIDAIGDAVVVLTNLSTLAGVNIEHCIDSAYGEISNRTGNMVNGTFVKDTV